MSRVLVTGGSGYLGQFVVAELVNAGHQVAYTYLSTKLPQPSSGSRAVGRQVDLAAGQSLQALFEQHGPFSSVINCAAISQPAVCEKTPDVARAVNIPSKLVDSLQAQKATHGVEALLVHISTDQVYDGSRSNWTEADVCRPVNSYGLSKLAAEQAIQERWPHHVILRSSIIYGPQPASPVGRTLFLQFMDNALREGKPTTFFDDEFRSPVFVEDIVHVLSTLAALQPGQAPQHKLYNMGGPERLSRLQMACKVAEARGYSQDAIVVAPAGSALRGVASPADISMDSSRLEADLALRLTPFSEALQLVFNPPQGA